MSRLSSMSPAAVRAFFSPDCDEHVIVLVTISAPGMETMRLADGFTQRIAETDEDVTYGVMSRGKAFTFLPLEITLPSEEEEAAPRASLTIHNVTRQVTPAIRELSGPPDVLLEVILARTPDLIEASFAGFKMSGIQYDAETVSGQLTVDSLAREPFPAHTFSPAWFPGLF